MNHENKYVPSIRWTPKEIGSDHAKENISVPTKSIYQADFSKSSSHRLKSAPTCKASMLKLLMHSDKRLASMYEQQQNKSLDQLQKRKYEIDQILSNS